MLIYTTAALACGFMVDLLFGDPQGWPHLVRAMGAWISRLERLLYPLAQKRRAGVYLVLLTVLPAFFLPLFLLWCAFQLSPWLYFGLETLFCWQLLATRSLQQESGRVFNALQRGDLAAARLALSMIVGRDTEQLDAAGISRAAVETVAENTCDGVVAPLFYLALGGVPLACLYKAVNTMDSMVGYRNARYLDFGRCAARLDDVLNWLPARLSALLIICAAALSRMDVAGAWRIWRRDRHKHASPNSAQSEAAMAGALGLRLAGDASYFGVIHHKPWIGDALRQIVPQDIRCAHQLLYLAALLMLVLVLLSRGVMLLATI